MARLRIPVALGLLGAALLGAVLWLGRGAPAILIEAPVAMPAMAGEGAPLAVTLTIVNPGGPDRLLSVASRAAGRVVLAGGEDPAGLAIPAGSAPSLAADGAHAMLMGLEGAAEEGRLIPLTLGFAEAGTVTAKARLLRPAEGAHAMHGMGAMGAMSGGAALDMPAAEAPALALAVSRDGEGWRVRADVARFRFAPEAMDGPHAPGEGHGHLYLGGLKLQRMTGPEARIGRLPPGRHVVRVTLNTNDHRLYAADGAPVSAEVAIVQP